MNKAVIGLQWGDEGKGKIVDFLSEKFDLVARYQGGNNAGQHYYPLDNERLSQTSQIRNLQFYLFPHRPIVIQ